MFRVSQFKIPAGHVTHERVNDLVLFFHVINSPGQV